MKALIHSLRITEITLASLREKTRSLQARLYLPEARLREQLLQEEMIRLHIDIASKEAAFYCLE